MVTFNNAQVTNVGKVPKKPGGYNHNHIPKALEHPTGPPNPQPSHKTSFRAKSLKFYFVFNLP